MSQTRNTTENSHLSFFRLTLGAGQQAERGVAGRFFICTEVEGGEGKPFELALNDNSFFPLNTGLKIQLPGGDDFSKVTLRNPTAASMVIEFYVGTIIVDDLRLNIIRGRSAPVMKAETVMTGHGGALGALATYDLSNTVTFPSPNAKYIRASTIVSNLDPAVDIEIRNQAGDVLMPVFFRQSILIESSDALKIFNPTGAPVVTRIAQSWYVIR